MVWNRPISAAGNESYGRPVASGERQSIFAPGRRPRTAGEAQVRAEMHGANPAGEQNLSLLSLNEHLAARIARGAEERFESDGILQKPAFTFDAIERH